MNFITYTAGYKYQLEEDFELLISLRPYNPSPTRFVSLSETGLLTIKAGYAWDGASGPAIDTDSFMRGALVHDALYQLIRMGVLSMEDRKAADEILYQLVRIDGMFALRAWWVYTAVRVFGEYYMKPHGHNVLTAPRARKANQ